jgi:glutathione S-transferase
MIVHGSSVSPFVRKVIAFAAEKGVALENRPTRFGDMSDEWIAKSPFGKIPAFEDGDYVLADSSAIVQYIEAKHPEKPLIPTEARARGKAIWFDEYADTIFVGQLGMIFFNRVVAPMLGMPQDLEAADKAEADLLPPHLIYLESVIPASGFLVEDRLTLADIAVASPFANMAHAGVLIDSAKYPKVAGYTQAILARPSFATVIEAEKKMFAR